MTFRTGLVAAACVMLLLPACRGDSSESRAGGLLRYAYAEKYARSQFGAAWKAYLEAMRELGSHRRVDPEVYLFGSRMCLAMYFEQGTVGQRAFCFDLGSDGRSPAAVATRREALAVSLRYLELAQAHSSGDRFAGLIACHQDALRVSDDGTAVSCQLSDDGALAGYFQPPPR